MSQQELLNSFRRMIADILTDLISVYYNPEKPVIIINFAGSEVERSLDELCKLHSKSETKLILDFVIEKFKQAVGESK